MGDFLKHEKQNGTTLTNRIEIKLHWTEKKHVTNKTVHTHRFAHTDETAR